MFWAFRPTAVMAEEKAPTGPLASGRWGRTGGRFASRVTLRTFKRHRVLSLLVLMEAFRAIANALLRCYQMLACHRVMLP